MTRRKRVAGLSKALRLLLAALYPRVLLVDDVDLALALNHLRARLILQRTKRCSHLHGIPFDCRSRTVPTALVTRLSALGDCLLELAV